MKIVTKYTIGDSVWYLWNAGIFCTRINGINTKTNETTEGTQIRYRVKGDVSTPSKEHVWLPENAVYHSKAALLQSL